MRHLSIYILLASTLFASTQRDEYSGRIRRLENRVNVLENAKIKHSDLTSLFRDDHDMYLRKDGTRTLQADWDIGAWQFTALNFISDVAIGTSPYACTSTTLNTNLNADLWDDNEFSDYLDQAVKQASSVIFGSLDISGTSQLDGNVTIGDGTAATDYTLTFDGETNDGVITWMEDEDYFSFNDNVYIAQRLLLPMGEVNYFNTTGTAITISGTSDGSTNMVVVNPATTFSNDMDFDNGGADTGRLRYTGSATKTFHVACTVSFSGAGANDLFVVGIAKGGTVISSSKILRKMGPAGDIGTTAMHVMVSMAQNDYLEVYAGNMTDTDDFTINTLTLFAMGM